MTLALLRLALLRLALLRLALLWSILLSQSLSPAAAADQRNGSGEIPTVHITGPGVQGPGLQNLNAFNPLGVEIDAEDLETSPYLGADEFLRAESGLLTFRRSAASYAHPTTAGASFRGAAATAASRTLVLLDGIPLNDPFGGWVYWNRVPYGMFDHAEISRGPGSLHYATAGLNGLLALSTAQHPANAVNGRLVTGSFGTADLAAAATVRHDENTITAAGSFLTSDGYYLLDSSRRGAIDRRAEVEAATAAASFSSALPRERTLSGFTIGYSEDKGGGTSATGNSTRQLLTALSITDRNVQSGSAQAAAYFQVQEFDSAFSSQEEDRSAEVPALDQHVPAATAGASLSWQREVDEALLLFGADLRWITGTTEEMFFFDEGSFRRFREAGGNQLFAGAHLGVKREYAQGLVVSAALRADAVRSYGLFQSSSTAATGELLSYQDGGADSHLLLTPRLAAEQRLNSEFSLAGNIYTGTRTPTLNELVRPFRVRNDVTLANADLEPERLIGTDLGLIYRSDRLSASAAAYYQRIEDQIVNLTVPQSDEPGPCGMLGAEGICRRRGNIDDAESYGFELTVEQKLTDVFSAQLQYFFTETNIRNADFLLEGRELPQVPGNQLRVGIEGRYEKLLGLLQLHYVDSQYEDDQNTLSLDSFILVDAYVGYRASADWSLFVQAENIFDERIETAKTADGLTTLGSPAAVRTGVTWEF